MPDVCHRDLRVSAVMRSARHPPCAAHRARERRAHDTAARQHPQRRRRAYAEMCRRRVRGAACVYADRSVQGQRCDVRGMR